MKHSACMITMVAGALASVALPQMASAAVVSLDFENINSTYPSTDYANVLDYYNGGTSSDGTSGTNYGVSFGSNALAICLNTPGNICSNTSRGGFGDPKSQLGGLFFLSGTETFLNVAAGFTTGFSFNYASSVVGSVGVFDGLNGTGNLLATLNLTPNLASGSCPSGSGDFCPFGPSGVTFAGTAKSISFGGVANQIVFDDITFGSAVPGPVSGVPEPATWGMMLLGFGMMGASMRYRRKSTRFVTSRAA